MEKTQIKKNDTTEIQKTLTELSKNIVQKRWRNTSSFYHYTSLPNLFDILENDCFWASNIRFSNDSTEVKLLNDDIHDDYVVCFCERKDQLSQWRGYCFEGGASIGFYIGYYQQYSILQADYDLSGGYIIYENAPIPVLYVEPKNVSRGQGKTELDYCVDYMDAKYKGMEDYKYYISPYIKNALFYEECESRLAFVNKSEELSKHIRFRKLESGIKTPYIVVKHGDVMRMKANCRTNPYSYDENKLQEIYKKHEEIWIDEGQDQELVFYEVLDRIKRFLAKNEYDGNAIKIFCKGHLPIDEIIVAPTSNRSRIREQVERFCRSKYWLKNVVVNESIIPYVK